MGPPFQKDKLESEYLLEMWEAGICPYCSKTIPEGTRVGSGRKCEGGFCSLDCYARYYQLELQARFLRLAEVRRRQHDL